MNVPTQAARLKTPIVAYDAVEGVDRTASTATATAPAEDNPWLNASRVKPLEAED